MRIPRFRLRTMTIAVGAVAFQRPAPKIFGNALVTRIDRYAKLKTRESPQDPDFC
jgi:hypothetical protein